MIRRLQPGDEEVFRRIRLEALRAEPAAYASTAADWEALPPEEWRRRLTANPVFVAFQGAEPVGIMGLMAQSSSKTAHRTMLIMVYLRPEQRGTGLAGRLLRHAVDHARRLGHRQVELMVSAENPVARRFYEREGFRQIGCIPGGFLHEGREVDEIMMVRRLLP